MTFTTLVDTENNFVYYLGDGQFATSCLPKLMKESMTSETFWKYVNEESGSTDKDIKLLRDVYRVVPISVKL